MGDMAIYGYKLVTFHQPQDYRLFTRGTFGCIHWSPRVCPDCQGSGYVPSKDGISAEFCGCGSHEGPAGKGFDKEDNICGNCQYWRQTHPKYAVEYGSCSEVVQRGFIDNDLDQECVHTSRHFHCPIHKRSGPFRTVTSISHRVAIHYVRGEERFCFPVPPYILSKHVYELVDWLNSLEI